jgi:competence protein ComEC
LLNGLLGRPLFLGASLWALGEVLGFFLVHTWGFLLLSCLTLFLLFIFLVRHFRLPWLFLLLALALPLGFWRCGSQAHETVPLGREGPATLVGQLKEDPQREGDRDSFFLQVFAVQQGEILEQREGLVYAQTWRAPSLQRGDLIRLEGTLERPQGEFATYLKVQGAFWSLRSGQATPLGSALTPLGQAILAAQRGAEALILKAAPPPEGPILVGILVGRVASLDPSLERPYRETSTAHILAASGINVALLLAFLLLLGRWLGLPRKVPLLLALPLVLLYATLCGWLPSIFRAAVMGLVGILALLSARERDALTTLSAAALLVLIVQPLALFALDFQLSFLATLALFAFFPAMQTWLPGRFPGWLKGAIVLTFAAQLGTLPLMASTFHMLSLVAPLANLAIDPLVTVILPMGLVGVVLAAVFPLLGLPLLWLAGKGVWLMDQAVRGLAALPASHWIVPSAPPWLELLYWVAFALAAGVCLLYLNPRRRRLATSVLLVLFVLFLIWEVATPLLFPVRQLEARFLDVGQGDSILVRTPQGVNILWDGGPGSACLRSLEELGINRLDLVILSHPHSDHLRGLATLLRTIPAQRVLIGPGPMGEEESAFLAELAAEGISCQQVAEGFQVRAGPTELTFLSPPATGAESWSTNDQSLVGRLRFGETTLLLPGDIEVTGREYLEHTGNDLQATVLKIPHHGSATGLDRAFLESVQPSWAVISVGEGNPYGLPSSATLALLEEEGVPTFLTSQRGTVLLESDGHLVTISTER